MTSNKKRIALLVGVSQYSAEGDPNPDFPDLRTPANDVAGLAMELRKPACGFDVKEVVNPDKQQLEVKIERLLNDRDRDDFLIFYFSGHGKLINHTHLHLCPKGARNDVIRASSVAFSWISELISSSKCERIVIILDCCYSGAASGELTPKSDVSGILLNDFGGGKGKYVMTSCSATDISIEFHQDKNSLFSKHLIDGLRTGKADLSGDGIITLDELYTYAAAETQRERKEQKPTNKGFETQGPPPEIARFNNVQGEAKFTVDAYPEPSARLMNLLEERPHSIIPFIGDRVYGSYPLSAFQLSKAIARKAKLSFDVSQPLVTAASYYEEELASRPVFLRKICEIVQEQSRVANVPALYDWLVEWDAPFLVVSTTYDLLFEKMLRKACKPFILICHMLRGKTGAEKTLLINCAETREASTFETHAADGFVIETDKERVIYKVLGSPCLSELVSLPENYDSLIITEHDHFQLFSNLNREQAGKPTALADPFRLYPILFLGYNLDIWHYRLVERVFRRSEWSRETIPFGVRQPQSTIEEKFWQRLDADMIRMDVDTFVRMVRETEDRNEAALLETQEH